MSTLKVDGIRSNSASSDAITLASDGTCTGNITNRPNYNRIINGQFDIWQRATTSGSVTASGYNSADRWYINQSGATSTTSRQAFTVGQTDVPSNPRYYLRMNATTANNNAGIEQRVEDVDTVQGEHTLSFWVKGTAPAGGNFDVRIFQNFGSGGSTSTEANLGTFSVSGSWVKKTFTFTPTSLSGKTVGTNSYFQISIRQPDSDSTTTAWILDIANVKLEAGSKATDYQKINIAQELALCQRYYYRLENDSSTTCHLGTCQYYTTNAFFGHIKDLPVKMRAIPTATLSGTAHPWTATGGANGSFTSLALNKNTKTSLATNGNTTSSSSGSTGNATVITLLSDSYIEASAEL